MHSEIRIEIQADDPALIPEYATEHSAGMDLKSSEDHVIQPMERVSVGTGIKVAIPQGFEGQVRPRSGMALKQGLSIPNAPGTIDSDYRGEVRVILINLGKEPITIQRGDRIAQLVIAPVTKAEWKQVQSLEVSVRGEGGFGSTGVK